MPSLSACPLLTRMLPHNTQTCRGSPKNTIFAAEHRESVTKVQDDEGIAEGRSPPLPGLLPTTLLVDRASTFLKGEVHQDAYSFSSCRGEITVLEIRVYF